MTNFPTCIESLGKCKFFSFPIPKRLNVKFTTRLCPKIILQWWVKIWYFSFNFSLKKIIFPPPQENYFFQSKTAQKKDAPGWRIFWARASQSKLTMGEAEKASEIAQGHAGHHLLVVASFTHSAVCSVAHCTLLNMTYLWSVSPEDNGRAKSEEESMEKMKGKCNGKWDFFSWDYRCQLLLGWWSIVKSNNIKFESYLCLIFMRCALQWWAFDCPATLRFSFCGLDLQKEHGRMKTENRDFRMSIVSHKYRFN